MSQPLRLHLRIEGGSAPFRQWTIDRPRNVSVGFAPTASIWVANGAAGPDTVLFEKAGSELRLRAFEGIDATLLIDGKELSLASLREAGLLRSDRSGDYVVVREKTTGTISLDEMKIQFWVTRAPAEPEYPLHPPFIHFLREVPWTIVSLFILVGLLESFVLRVFYTLPAPMPPTLQEVNRVFSRYQLPEEYGRLRFKKQTTNALSDPSRGEGGTSQAQNKPSKGPLPQRGPGGFLSAVARHRPGSSSPFSSLFTTSTLSGDMDKVLKGGDFGKAVTESLKGFGSQPQGLAGAPQALGIGSIRQAGTKEAQLIKVATAPIRPRLTYEGTAVGGSVDRDALEQVKDERSGELLDCYERALTRNPSLAGKLVIRLILRKSGSHSLSADDRSTLKDPGLIRCAVERMSAWPFQTPKSDSDPILLPFIFSPASKG